MPATDLRKTVLITGCSPNGVGDALAKEFVSRGFLVFATTLAPETMPELEALGCETFHLDVTSASEVENAVKFVGDKTGGNLDMLVNNAGIAYLVPAVDMDMEEVIKLFHVNLFGVMRMVKAFHRLLIESKGTILNIGSLAGIMPYPYGACYNSCKAALHHYGNSLRVELMPFEVKVMTVFSGGLQSRLVERNLNKMVLPPDSVYVPIEAEYNARLQYSQSNGTAPRVYAREVVTQALKTNPPKWYWAAFFSWQAWFIDTFLWRGVWDNIMYKKFGLAKLSMILRKKKTE